MSEFVIKAFVGFVLGALIVGLGWLLVVALMAFATWDTAPLAFVTWTALRVAIALGIFFGLLHAIVDLTK